MRLIDDSGALAGQRYRKVLLVGHSFGAEIAKYRSTGPRSSCRAPR